MSSSIGVRHVGLLAKDPVALTEFYSDVLGMKVVRQTPPDSPVGTTVFLWRIWQATFCCKAVATSSAKRVASLVALVWPVTAPEATIA